MTDRWLGIILLVGAAAALTDWAALVVGEAGPTCAKTEAQCHEFQVAVRSGWIIGIARDQPVACVPMPGCFPTDSLCIKGYNC